MVLDDGGDGLDALEASKDAICELAMAGCGQHSFLHRNPWASAHLPGQSSAMPTINCSSMANSPADTNGDAAPILRPCLGRQE